MRVKLPMSVVMTVLPSGSVLETGLLGAVGDSCGDPAGESGLSVLLGSADSEISGSAGEADGATGSEGLGVQPPIIIKSKDAVQSLTRSTILTVI